MARTIQQYRTGRNYIRVRDIVKVRLPGKHPFLGPVTEIQVPAAEGDDTPTGVTVTIVAKANGQPHARAGMWRCVPPDQVERIAQSGTLAKQVKELVR